MNDKTVLKTEKRSTKKTAARSLRKAGSLPGNIFGEGKESVAISLSQLLFEKTLDAIGESGLIYLSVDGVEEPVLIDEVQLDSVTNQPIHCSFRRVNLKEKVSSEVPIELEGELSVPNAVLVLTQDSVEVEALPADLPEKIIVKTEQFTELGQQLDYTELDYDRDAVTLLVEEERMNEPVVLVQEVKEEVVEETPTEGEAAEAETEKSPEEGESAQEKPAEGASEKQDNE